MQSEARLLLDVWEGVRDLLPAAKRSDAVQAILRAFADHGCESHDLVEARDDDDDIATGFDEVFGDSDVDEDMEEDDE